MQRNAASGLFTMPSSLNLPEVFDALQKLSIFSVNANSRARVQIAEIVLRDLLEPFQTAQINLKHEMVYAAEMGHILISNCIWNIQIGSTGIPVPEYEVKIVDDYLCRFDR